MVEPVSKAWDYYHKHMVSQWGWVSVKCVCVCVCVWGGGGGGGGGGMSVKCVCVGGGGGGGELVVGMLKLPERVWQSSSYVCVMFSVQNDSFRLASRGLHDWISPEGSADLHCVHQYLYQTYTSGITSLVYPACIPRNDLETVVLHPI